MRNRYKLAMHAVDLYETRRVDSVFAPLANATLEKFEIGAGDQVLDVACGTGIVARTVRGRCGPEVQIAGVDINDMMLAKAQSMSRSLPGQIDWYVSDVTNLSAFSDTFSYVFCQQGLQYFPDDLAALTEMQRVLSADGKLILTVWTSANEYFLAQSEAMKKYVSAEAGEMALAPFSYPAASRVPGLLTRLGFNDVTTATLTVDQVTRNAETGVLEDILGSPLSSMVENIEPSVLEKIVRDIVSACSKYLQDGDIKITQQSTLIVASAD